MRKGIRGRPGIGAAIGATGRAGRTGCCGRAKTNSISLPEHPVSLTEFLEKLPLDKLPAGPELLAMCRTAGQVNAICELLGIESAAEAYDPDPPYIWDEET